MKKNVYRLMTVLILVTIALAACAPAVAPVPETVVEKVEITKLVESQVEVVVTATPGPEKILKVFGAFATPIEEPWDGVIHAALNKAQADGRIEYTYQEAIGYSGDMERVLREVCEQQKPDLILGDAFGNEEAVRRVAKDFPEVAFAFGSGSGPTEPNVAVFDNWIHEPAYLMGMLAGGLTKTNKLGVVGAMPVPEVNRLTNAFIAGAKAQNPDVVVMVSFINSWFDPAAAKEAAIAMIDNGADVLYAERFGVIEAAAEKGLFSFGNMSDQNELAPDFVVSSAVWNMDPTVDYLINQVSAGTFTAQDLKDFSMMGKGGASLASFHGTEAKLPADLVAAVKAREAEIMSGMFRVDVSESQPAGSN
ncbi:MAG: BMP family ABC transporter substrate-binding protein [Anaerolinea sp.]|nr:BMP family ABC transporter substrate-binding protein [Anaerolinea sp.]